MAGQILQIVRYDFSCRKLIEFIKNMQAYIIESIKFKKQITHNIEVEIGSQTYKLTDKDAIDAISSRIDEFIVILNRGKPFEFFSNKISGGAPAPEYFKFGQD
jgi:hypothetical protein